MTMDVHKEGTALPGPDRFATPGRRLARVGMALGLSAALALSGGCRRQSKPTVDPAVKAWFDDSFRPATDDMAKAAGGGKDVKEGCKAAADALTALGYSA